MSAYADDAFWVAYARYVVDTRPEHQRLADMILTRRPLGVTLDLGCGRTREARNLFDIGTYVGVDADAAAEPDVCMNYRDVDGLADTLKSKYITPTTFVSLFSTELTANPKMNNTFYHELFDKIPSLRRGVVAGFYYSGRRDQAKVSETGGIESWQSIGDLTTGVRETRVLSRVPSLMFGVDVVEVWRLLEKM